MTDINHRVTKLEDWKNTADNDVIEIKTKIGHIESDMSEIKTISRNNALANSETAKKQTDTNLILTEIKAFMKAAAWIFGMLISITGLVIAAL